MGVDVALTNDVVALYDALGGGWQQDAVKVQTPDMPVNPPLVPGALDTLAAGSSR
jgi:hypothetical protein